MRGAEGAAGADGTRPGRGGACLGTLPRHPGVPRSRSKWWVLISPAEKVIVVLCLTRICQGDLSKASENVCCVLRMLYTCVCALCVCVFVLSPTEHPLKGPAPPTHIWVH